MGQNGHDCFRTYQLCHIPSSCGVLLLVLAKGIACHVQCGLVSIGFNTSGSCSSQKVTGARQCNPTFQAQNS